MGHLTVFGSLLRGLSTGERSELRPRPHESPLLDLPGAVAGNGVDAPVAAHYGSFNGEQRTLEAGDGFVDLSHRGVVRVSGPDRLTWLHSLTTQYFEDLAPRTPTQALVLEPAGPRRARDVTASTTARRSPRTSSRARRRRWWSSSTGCAS